MKQEEFDNLKPGDVIQSPDATMTVAGRAVYARDGVYLPGHRASCWTLVIPPEEELEQLRGKVERVKYRIHRYKEGYRDGEVQSKVTLIQALLEILDE